MWKDLAARIAQFEQRIQEQMRPFGAAVERWMSLPGIGRVIAWTVVAEMGVDMTQFPTAAHAAAWAALCPGQEESAGKRYSGLHAPRQRVATACAHLGSLGRQHHQGVVFQSSVSPAREPERAETRDRRRGARSARHWLYPPMDRARVFEDLSEDYFEHLDRDRLTKRLVKRLERLGHKVTLQAA